MISVPFREAEKAAQEGKGHIRPLILRNYTSNAITKSASMVMKRGAQSSSVTSIIKRLRGKKLHFAFPDGSSFILYPYFLWDKRGWIIAAFAGNHKGYMRFTEFRSLIHWYSFWSTGPGIPLCPVTKLSVLSYSAFYRETYVFCSISQIILYYYLHLPIFWHWDPALLPVLGSKV